MATTAPHAPASPPTRRRLLAGRLAAALLLAALAACTPTSPIDPATPAPDPNATPAPRPPMPKRAPIKGTDNPNKVGRLPAPWKVMFQSKMDKKQLVKQRRAKAALKTYKRNLLIAIYGALQRDGSAAAVEEYAKRTGTLRKAIESEHRLKIGRTAATTWGRGNAPTPWMRPIVDAKISRPITIVNTRDGRLLRFEPVRTDKACASCHGHPALVEEGVPEELKKHYPKAAPGGFIVGDLQGWLWAEVQ